MPIIIQFNKRDLDDIRSDEELESIARQSREPIYRAVATRGFGVMQTLNGLIRETWNRLEEEHQLERRFGIHPSRFVHEVEDKLRHRAGSAER